LPNQDENDFVFTVLLLRLGLRPLGNMAATATAIAGGDTNRRVPVDGAYTEVGRLAAALNHAFDQRQRAEDQLRGYIADASHELRTPLTTIRGWADLYFQGGLPDAAAIETAMSRIADEAGHVSRLVEELLLARLDHQRPLGTDAVDLATIAREVAADAQVIDPQRPITLTLPQDPGEAVAVGDADRLRQVVRNLVGNALQNTPPGTPIQVGAGLDADDPVHWVRLSVADHGPGIPATDLPHVFERFYRSTRDSAGTGLGLAIVRAIVQAQGGTVQVWSEPGRGTRFDVTLPRAIDTALARTVS
jgi:two-component system OmpR family sensor kinase